MTPGKTRQLDESSPRQLQEFLDSFDTIFTDCDGVLWHFMAGIDGALESVNRLMKLGKRIYFVTNNSMIPTERYRAKLAKFGIDVSLEQIVNTAVVATWYLKKIKFTGQAFVIGATAFRAMLSDAGINVVPRGPAVDENDIPMSFRNVSDQPSVKAVVVDGDIDYGWPQLALAISCLRRNDVLYMCGACDDWVMCDMTAKENRILGPGPLTEIITRKSGRTPLRFGKPSELLKEYLFQTSNVQDPSRCLFIGDTIEQDMKFAALCGFQKLLVGTGIDSLETAVQSGEARPNYYIPSLGQLGPLIDALLIVRE